MAHRMPNMDKMLRRFGWVDDDPSKDVDALYMCWLYGVSLPKLTKVLYGTDSGTTLDTSTLSGLFIKRYGNLAINVCAKSLLRSLAEDYPECKVTEAFILDNMHYVEPPKSAKALPGNTFKSNKGLDNISRFEGKSWTSPETLDRLGVKRANGRKVVTREQ